MGLPTKKTPPIVELAKTTSLIYGPPKVGKSTWCSHADGILFLATEAGLNHLDTFQVPCTSWDVLLNACKEIAGGQHEFKTICIDTVDSAYRLCNEHVCEQNKIAHPADMGYGKGFSLVNNEFERVLRKLSLLPQGLILVSHSRTIEEETRTGTTSRTVPTLPQKAREIVMSLVDVILYCDIKENKEGELERVAYTKRTASFEAGDRTGRLPAELPLDYAAFKKAFEAAKKAK